MANYACTWCSPGTGYILLTATNSRDATFCACYARGCRRSRSYSRNGHQEPEPAKRYNNYSQILTRQRCRNDLQKKYKAWKVMALPVGHFTLPEVVDRYCRCLVLAGYRILWHNDLQPVGAKIAQSALGLADQHGLYIAYILRCRIARVCCGGTDD